MRNRTGVARLRSVMGVALLDLALWGTGAGEALRELIATDPIFFYGLAGIFLLDTFAVFVMEDGEVKLQFASGVRLFIQRSLQTLITIGVATLISNMFQTFAWMQEFAYVAVSGRHGSHAVRRVYAEDDAIRQYAQDALREFYRRHLHLAANPDVKRPKKQANEANRS